jgi:uncharacterized repeat protein (TIGR01451 family)
MRLAGLAGLCLAATLALAFAPAASGLGPPCDSGGGFAYVVQTKADQAYSSGDPNGPDDKLSLREAIGAANDDGFDSGIVVPAGTYPLTLGELSLGAGSARRCALLVVGAGTRSTVIAGNGTARLLNLHGGGGAPTTIARLTLTGGYAHGDSGGAILLGVHNGGGVTLQDMSIRGNRATKTGGAIFTRESIVVDRSTISGNEASPTAAPSGGTPLGGGVHVGGLGSATFTNTTIAGNSVHSGSGGDGDGGGVAAQGTVELIHSTLAGNSASGRGGNLSPGANTTVYNTLTAAGQPDDCAPGTLATLSGDKSMSSDSSCTGITHPAGVSQLGALLNNGGPTDTRALLAGNPAIDAVSGVCPVPPTTDQRGVDRPDTGCDVGAYELVQDASLTMKMTRSPNPVAQHRALTYVITVRSYGPPNDATQPVVKDVLPAGVTLLRTAPSQGTCTGTKTVKCALGTVQNGHSATVSIRVRVDATVRSISNTASESSPRSDISLDDDQLTLATKVNPTDLDDTVVGTAAADRLCGLLGDDTVKGLRGDDFLSGDGCGRASGPGGHDTLIGGRGADALVGGGGRNVYDGGPGNDRVDAVNGEKDEIDCGAGSGDRATADPQDSVVSCETVNRVTLPRR